MSNQQIGEFKNNNKSVFRLNNALTKLSGVLYLIAGAYILSVFIYRLGHLEHFKEFIYLNDLILAGVIQFILLGFFYMLIIFLYFFQMYKKESTNKKILKIFDKLYLILKYTSNYAILFAIFLFLTSFYWVVTFKLISLTVELFIFTGFLLFQNLYLIFSCGFSNEKINKQFDKLFKIEKKAFFFWLAIASITVFPIITPLILILVIPKLRKKFGRKESKLPAKLSALIVLISVIYFIVSIAYWPQITNFVNSFIINFSGFSGTSESIAFSNNFSIKFWVLGSIAFRYILYGLSSLKIKFITDE